MVTGGSDGIGLSFCKELASLSFNIVMIARHQNKMNESMKQIERINPEVKVKTIVFDFSKSSAIADY